MNSRAVVKITSQHLPSFFATGFYIRDNAGLLVVTCRRVVILAGGIDQVRVEGRKVRLRSKSDDDDDAIDLALLEVDASSDSPVLTISTQALHKGARCEIHCYGHFDSETVELREMHAKIVETTFREGRRNAVRVPAAIVTLTDDLAVGPGSSGAPICEPDGDVVIGVITHGLGSPTSFSALSIAALSLLPRSPITLSEGPTTPSPQSFAARISLDPWIRKIVENNDIPEGWLLDAAGARSQGFAEIAPFLEHSLKHGVVQVVSEKHEISLQLSRTDDFFALLFGVFLIRTRNEGRCRWFIKRSNAMIDAGADMRFVKQIWSSALLHARSDVQLDTLNWVVQQVIVEAQGKKNELLFQFVSLLYDVFNGAPKHIRVIIDRLKDHDNQTGEEAKPTFLTSLKTLIGRGLQQISKAKDQPLTFNPSLKHIPISQLCSYGFQAMVTPLTEEDVFALLGEEASSFTYPYTFPKALEAPFHLFNQLSSQVRTILENVQ